MCDWQKEISEKSYTHYSEHIAGNETTGQGLLVTEPSALPAESRCKSTLSPARMHRALSLHAWQYQHCQFLKYLTKAENNIIFIPFCLLKKLNIFKYFIGHMYFFMSYLFLFFIHCLFFDLISSMEYSKNNFPTMWMLKLWVFRHSVVLNTCKVKLSLN